MIDHAVGRATQHERWRYWTARIFAASQGRGAVAPFVDDRPPAAVGLLLAAVKSPAHLAWVRKQMRYNLRADGREGSVAISPALLAARYVLLHGAGMATSLWRLGDAVEAVTGEALAREGYPEPGGALYLLLRLEAELPLPGGLTAEALAAARGEGGGSHAAPVLRTLAWLFALGEPS